MTVDTTYSEVPTDPAENGRLTGAQPISCKVYKRRWLMLVIFMIYSMANSAQWIQYAIISNIIVRYYGVSSYAVDWTSIIFMLLYTIFIFPGFYVMKKMGLRKCLIIGSLGTAVGSWVKCLSVSPDRYLVTFLGQTLVGVSQVFMLSVPPELAPVWFGSDQVSTACSLGVFGNQLGVAAAFLLMPVVVRNHSNLDDVGSDLAAMFYFMAALTTLAFLLILFLFEDQPPLPPSIATAMRGPNEGGIMKSMRELLRNKGFNLLMLSYGISVGVLNAFSTLLNQVILKYFENGEEFAGRVGLVFIVGGMVGSVVCGVFLDKTHRFKETTLTMYGVSAVAMLVFTFVLSAQSQLVVYLLSIVLGVSIGGYMLVGFEFVSELTYPELESTTSGLLLWSSCILGVVFTVIYAWLLNVAGDMWANASLTATLVVGLFLTALIKSDLKRQKAQNVVHDPRTSS